MPDENFVDKAQRKFSEQYTASSLKALIVMWAILVIIVTIFFVDNPWILAGILAYEVLP